MTLAAITLRDFLHPLALFGFAGQFVFMLRFMVQWFASERRRRSYVPVAFWWISCAGGVMLFSYALLREDVVFMAGQFLGLSIYARNLVLIYRRRSRLARHRRGLVFSGQEPQTAGAELEARVLGEFVEDDAAIPAAKD